VVCGCGVCIGYASAQVRGSAGSCTGLRGQFCADHIAALHCVWRSLTHQSIQPAQWTLNGAAYIDRFASEEMEAIPGFKSTLWGGAEAVGGSYSGYARVSTHSGLPAVLGWPGHESQWRGGTPRSAHASQILNQSTAPGSGIRPGCA
jgi:uncharacterized membrane protein